MSGVSVCVHLIKVSWTAAAFTRVLLNCTSMHIQTHRCTVTEAEVKRRLHDALPRLCAASEAVGALRAQSSYNWVDLSGLFGKLVPQAKANDNAGQ